MKICFVDIFKDPQTQVELGKYVVIANWVKICYFTILAQPKD